MIYWNVASLVIGVATAPMKNVPKAGCERARVEAPGFSGHGSAGASPYRGVKEFLPALNVPGRGVGEGLEVFAGEHAELLFEEGAKMFHVLEADGESDFGDGHLRFCQ